MAVTEQFSPLRLSPQHNPVSAPRSQGLGRPVWGDFTTPPGKPGAQDCAVPHPPSPPSPPPQSRMPSRLCRHVFLLQAEGLLLSVHGPLEGLLPPQTTTKQARPQPDPQDAGDGSSSLKLGAAPEAVAPRAGGPASGHSEHWARQSDPQTRSGPRARVRATAVGGEKHTASAEEQERKGESRPRPSVLTWSRT